MKKLILTILIMLTATAFGSGNVEIVDEGFRVMSPDGTQIAFLSSEGLGTFENLKDNSLAVNTAVYTTSGKILTTTAPATGTLGFWTRTTGPATLTTATAGDKIVTTGTVQGGAIIIPDNGFIGSVSEPGSMQIDASGDVIFSDAVQVGAGFFTVLGTSNFSTIALQHSEGFGTLSHHDGVFNFSDDILVDGTITIGDGSSSVDTIIFAGNDDRGIFEIEWEGGMEEGDNDFLVFRAEGSKWDIHLGDMNIIVDGATGTLTLQDFDIVIEKDTKLGFSSVNSTTISNEYILPQVVGTTNYIVKQTGTDTKWGYVDPATLSVALAAAVTVTNSTDATSFIAMFDSATGNLPIRTDADGLTYNSSTKSLGIGGDMSCLEAFVDSGGATSGVNISATVFADFRLKEGVNTGFFFRADFSRDQTIMSSRVRTGNQFVFVSANEESDYDHPTPVNPTIFLHSIINPNTSNNQWGSFYHNQNDFIIETGVATGAGGTAPTDIRNALILKATGGTILGIDGVNELQVSATGDLSFAGTGGFIEGHMTIPSVDIVVDTSANDDPVEVADDGTGVPDAGDGWASVYQNEVTFAVSDLHYQTVTIAGTYKVIWDMSPKTDAGGGTVIHGGIMIDGVAVRDSGEGHAHIFNANDNIQINGVGVIDCPNGNEEISLWVSNNANQKTAIEHGNMNVQLIGGT